MDSICFVCIEVLVVVTLIADLLAERDIEANDLLAIIIHLSLQVDVVLFLDLLELLQPLISLFTLLLLLLPQLILIFLLLLDANLVYLVLQRSSEAVFK